MKKLITILALIPFLLAAPASATTYDDDVAGRVFQHRNGTIILAVALDMDEPELATLAVEYADTDMLEEDLDILIVEEDRITGRTLRGLGADAAYMYGFLDMESTEPGLLLVASEGTTFYLMMIIGDLEDTDPFAEFTWNVIHDGLEDAEAPDGYPEVETEEEATPNSL